MAVAIVFGALAGMLISRLVDYFGGSKAGLQPADVRPLLLGLLPMAALAIVIHELGHLVVGLMQGFVFQLFVFAFFGVRRNQDAKIECYFNTDWQLFGGVAASIPQDFSEHRAVQFARVLLAGPLTSLLLAVTAASLANFLPKPWSLWGFTLAAMSLAIFAATTIPSQAGVLYSDRKRFQRLMAYGTPARLVELAVLEATSRRISGGAPAEIGLDKIRLIQQDESAFFQYYGTVLEYQYQQNCDPAALPEIRDRLAVIAERLPKSIVNSFAAELQASESG